MREYQILAILFALPLAVASTASWFISVKKIQPTWVIAAVVYAILYVSLFHFWLKAF